MRPKLVSYRQYDPPFGGGKRIHRCLCPIEILRIAFGRAEFCELSSQGLRYAWIFDVRVPKTDQHFDIADSVGSRLLRKGRKFRHTQSLGKPAGRFPEFTFHFRNLLPLAFACSISRTRFSRARLVILCRPIRHVCSIRDRIGPKWSSCLIVSWIGMGSYH